MCPKAEKKSIKSTNPAKSSKKVKIAEYVYEEHEHLHKEHESHIFPVSWEKLLMQGIHTHNLKNIDITLPKNKIITITGVSGSGKSSLAFDTIYKEGQFKYIESLSSYLRQFFNLGARPEVEYTEWLSPAIAIEQNKRVGNSRSTVGTLTEIDDYLRLMMAKLGEVYCRKCGMPLKPKTTDQILADVKAKFFGKKVYMIQEMWTYKEADELARFVRRNRKRVDQWEGITRYLLALQYDSQEHTRDNLVEYFYLEEPNIPLHHLPVKVYGIFDRVTITDETLSRLKEDSIRMLAMADKFGVYTVEQHEEGPGDLRSAQQVTRYTDKYYCPKDNIKYPEFSSQHFSPNRQEGACETCHGIGEQLQVDFDKVLDPFSPYLKAILPWRDSALGQAILKKLAYQYNIKEESFWKDLPEDFRNIVIEWDNELMKLSLGGGKYVSMHYKGVEHVLTDQYTKGVLTVDFQAMMQVRSCPACEWSKLRKESLHVFLNIPVTHAVLNAENVKNAISIPEIENTQEMPKKAAKTDKKKANKIAWDIVSDKISNAQETYSVEQQYYLHQNPAIKHYNIADLQRCSIEQLSEVMESYEKTTQQPHVLVHRIAKPLLDRTKTIQVLGMSYITTLRQIDTLSGGEIQRLRLAKQLGNKLTGIIYVLDEPTIGLDTGEIERVIWAIKWLKDMWNTIIVVEHNEDFIKNSDWIVEVWPGAGDFGGRILYSGPYDAFLKTDTLTAQYITKRKKVHVDFSHKPTDQQIRIKKASQHNLKHIDATINLWSFTIITWPSWAGKTTLMYHTLFKFMEEKTQFVQSYIRLNLLKQWMTRNEIIAAPVMKRETYEHYEQLALQEFYKHLGVESILGYDQVKNVLYVDQSSIGKTPRSCPATFIGLFDDIRKLYAGATEAKMLWFGAGHFSFNSDKWSCPECDGYGYKKVELQFLPDTYVPCSLCRWKRYKPEILAIKRHGKNISEILDMYVMDAYDFFGDLGFLAEPLELMVDIGLGYIKLGQPAHTLSGGESQRIKLVKHLLKSYKWHTLYFLDEPTVGLHPADIEKLLRVLKKFLDNGDTILMIEHEKSLMEFADRVITLDNWKIKNAKG